MTCPACGEEERQDRKVTVWRKRAGLLSSTPESPGQLVLHRECPSGHALAHAAGHQAADEAGAL